MAAAACKSAEPRPRGRRVYLLSHGQDTDSTIPNWMEQSFTRQGEMYHQSDLNLPWSMPRRKGYPKSFKGDSPLTQVGRVQCGLVGEALKEKKKSARITQAYSSPSLRCIETCFQVLQGMDLSSTIPIRIEPGLFQWLHLHRQENPQSSTSLPVWMTKNELVRAGFKVDLEYTPALEASSLTSFLKNYSGEVLETYYGRTCFTITSILDSSLQDEHFPYTFPIPVPHTSPRSTRDPEGNGDVLVVAHPSSLEAAVRSLLGGDHMSGQDTFLRIVQKLPPASMIVIEELSGTKAGWKLMNSPIPKFSLAQGSADKLDASCN